MGSTDPSSPDRRAFIAVGDIDWDDDASIRRWASRVWQHITDDWGNDMTQAPSTVLTDRYTEAVGYATGLHAKQTRKGNTIAYACHVTGRASLGSQRLGKGARAAGMVVGLGSAIYVLGGIAARNLWNPVGWVAGAVGVLAAVLSIFGRRKVKNAGKEQAKARSKNLGMSRRVVHEAFDEYESTLSHLILDELRDLVSPSIRSIAEEAVGLKRALLILQQLEADLALRMASIPSVPPSATVVHEARQTVQHRPSTFSRRTSMRSSAPAGCPCEKPRACSQPMASSRSMRTRARECRCSIKPSCRLSTRFASTSSPRLGWERSACRRARDRATATAPGPDRLGHRPESLPRA
jgi:hypothetical protein